MPSSGQLVELERAGADDNKRRRGRVGFCLTSRRGTRLASSESNVGYTVGGVSNTSVEDYNVLVCLKLSPGPGEGSRWEQCRRGPHI